MDSMPQELPGLAAPLAPHGGKEPTAISVWRRRSARAPARAPMPLAAASGHMGCPSRHECAHCLPLSHWLGHCIPCHSLAGHVTPAARGLGTRPAHTARAAAAAARHRRRRRRCTAPRPPGPYQRPPPCCGEVRGAESSGKIEQIRLRVSRACDPSTAPHALTSRQVTNPPALLLSASPAAHYLPGLRPQASCKPLSPAPSPSAALAPPPARLMALMLSARPPCALGAPARQAVPALGQPRLQAARRPPARRLRGAAAAPTQPFVESPVSRGGGGRYQHCSLFASSQLPGGTAAARSLYHPRVGALGIACLPRPQPAPSHPLTCRPAPPPRRCPSTGPHRFAPPARRPGVPRGLPYCPSPWHALRAGELWRWPASSPGSYTR